MTTLAPVRSWMEALPARFGTKRRLIGSSLLRLGLGTAVALATVFRLREYRPPLFADFLAGSPLIHAFAGYFTLAFEGAFPLLVWSRKGRVAAVIMALMLHVEIILFMGLVAFGLRMIFYQAVLLSDDQYLWLGRRLRSAASRKDKRAIEAGRGRVADSPA